MNELFSQITNKSPIISPAGVNLGCEDNSNSLARPEGLVQITVPSPYTRAVTVDWGYPKEEAHGHYRGYGKDILQRFAEAEPGAMILQVEVIDQVTDAGGYVYLWSLDAALIQQLGSWIDNPIVVG